MPREREHAAAVRRARVGHAQLVGDGEAPARSRVALPADRDLEPAHGHTVALHEEAAARQVHVHRPAHAVEPGAARAASRRPRCCPAPAPGPRPSPRGGGPRRRSAGEPHSVLAPGESAHAPRAPCRAWSCRTRRRSRSRRSAAGSAGKGASNGPPSCGTKCLVPLPGGGGAAGAAVAVVPLGQAHEGGGPADHRGYESAEHGGHHRPRAARLSPPPGPRPDRGPPRARRASRAPARWSRARRAPRLLFLLLLRLLRRAPGDSLRRGGSALRRLRRLAASSGASGSAGVPCSSPGELGGIPAPSSSSAWSTAPRSSPRWAPSSSASRSMAAARRRATSWGTTSYTRARASSGTRLRSERASSSLSLGSRRSSAPASCSGGITRLGPSVLTPPGAQRQHAA